MRRTSIFIFYLLLLILHYPVNVAVAQFGNPFITNLSYPEGIDNEHYDLIQDPDGIMLFANNKGLLSYNGIEWKYANMNVIPHQFLYYKPSRNLFMGCENSYGILVSTEPGNYQYYDLSTDFSEVGNISQIKTSENRVYFMSSNTISELGIYNPDLKRIWRSTPGNPYSGLLVVNEKAFVNVMGIGLHVVGQDSLRLIEGGDSVAAETIVFSFEYDQGQVMFGTDLNRLFLFDGENLSPFEIKDHPYLLQNFLTDGMDLSEEEFALSTLTGGTIVINKSDLETNYTFNYQSGLPDDEILCMGTDAYRGLWLAHEFGISRIDFSFPVRNYNVYPGLQGNLINTKTFNGKIYVSTSEGIYFLNEVRDYEEIEVWTRVQIPAKPVTSEAVKEVQEEPEKAMEPVIAEMETETIDSVTPKRKGFFARLFGKKDQPEEPVTPAEDSVFQEENTEETVTVADEPPATEEKRVVAKPRYKYVRKKINALQSISHLFTKINGLEGKCKQLHVFDGRLFAATNIGLYEIADTSAKEILPNIDVNVLASSLNGELLFMGTPAGIYLLRKDGGEWIIRLQEYPVDEIGSVWQQGNGLLWLGGKSIAYRCELSGDEIVNWKSYPLSDEQNQSVLVRGLNNKPFFFAGNSAFTYDISDDMMLNALETFPITRRNPQFITSQHNITWALLNQEWELLTVPEAWQPGITKYIKLFDEINDIYIDEESNLWIIHGRNQISKILNKESYTPLQDFRIYFTGLTDANKNLFLHNNVSINYDQFPIDLDFSAPYFVRSEGTLYQYWIEPIHRDWTSWTTQNNHIVIPNLLPGRYSLKIRAKNILGGTSNIQTLDFYVNPPFYRSWWFVLFSVLALALIIYAIILLWIGKLRRDKTLLEEKVKERTAEIEQQKEEIITQREEMVKQRDEIVLKNKEITESIHYASRIQSAMLPPDSDVSKFVSQYFIINMPRDIVSGDFYWFKEVDEKLLIVAADCTGHGIPGAFMSMLGLSALNDIVNNYKANKASLILNRLRDRVIDALHQEGRSDEAHDGMDIALCIIDKKNGKLQFAGAFNPLYHFRDGDLNIIKADKMPIAYFDRASKSFTNHEINIKSGDTIYLFSDGFIDQFGGKTGGKYKSKNYIELLKKIQDKTLDQQAQSIERAYKRWKGKYDQVDDILILGLKI